MTDWTTKADNWIEEHPDEFQAFCTLACISREHNEKYGAKAIIERMRWASKEYKTLTNPDGYLYNNNFTSTLARRAMEKHQELKGYFELRGSR